MLVQVKCNIKNIVITLFILLQDFSQYDGKGDGKGLQMQKWNTSAIDIVSDITEIPQPDLSFDAILCSEVFEHIPDPIVAIKEFSRLLKSGGILLVTAPFCSLTHFAPYHFSTGFNKYFYQKILFDAGYDIKEITPNGDYFSYLAQEVKSRIPNNYTSYKLNWFDKLIVKYFNKLLYKLYLNDTNSSELLCFGYFVKAIKK